MNVGEYLQGVSNDRLEYVISFSDQTFKDLAITALPENRDIRKAKVKKIAEAFKRGEYIAPIMVKIPEMIIVEGNHRYEAAKVLYAHGYPFTLWVHFFKGKYGVTSINIADSINNTQSKWYASDRLDSYCKRGNEHYLRLKRFIEDHPTLITKEGKPNIGATLMLFAKEGKKEGVWLKSFNDGTLKLTTPDLHQGEQLMNELQLIQGAFINECNEPLTTLISKSAIKAWAHYRGDASMIEWTKKIKKFVKKMGGSVGEPKGSYRAWKTFFDRIWYGRV